MKVYQAINAVQTELAKIGISKSSRNSQGAGYNFRGIDAVYNVLSSIMAQHSLCIIPRMLTRTCEERTSKSGGALFYVTVEAEFDLVSAEDGSKHTARTFGEAMDSSDKATNKAMSAAYKYMAFQTFAIPTEGDNDADGHTHEVVKQKPTLDAKRLQSAIEKIIAGQYTTEKLRDTFTLTPAQEKQVTEALANA
jgi:hypothetical protein